jgi:integrase
MIVPVGRLVLTMQSKLTTIRSIELADEGFTWDTELRGFGLKVTSKGKRIFLVQKRPHKGAKTLKRYTIGVYPSVSLTEARTAAKAILGRITLGLPTSPVLGQPGGSFKEEIENYYQGHIRIKLKPTTIRDMRYMIDKYLLPWFGDMSLEGVTHSLVRSMHTTLGSKHPYRANRVLALLSKFFSWMTPTGVNPCRGIEKFREIRREPPSGFDPSVLVGTDSTVRIHPAIRLLILTGMRKSEVLGLRWEYLDWSGSTIHFPDSKTGEKIVYLSPVALELLRGLQSSDEGWVFPGKSLEGRRGNTFLQKVWKKVLKGVGLPADTRIHDLRHYYASLAATHLTVPQVAGLLGHKDIKTTMRYVHSKDLGDAARLVGERLDNFFKGRTG